MPRKNDPRPATRRGSPPLGNGLEDSLSDETLGKLSRGNGPESQGAYGDEDFDSSHRREGEVAASARPEPREPPDELARRLLDEERDERMRDDLAVHDDIVDVLTAALPPIRDLRVEVAYGRVTLDGVVADRSMLGVAEEVASRVPGVVEVVPRLRVEPA